VIRDVHLGFVRTPVRIALAAGLVLGGLMAAPAQASGPHGHGHGNGNADRPVLSPATGGNGQPVLAGTDPSVLKAAGYEQRELFFSGTATAYQPAANTTLTADGQWTIKPAADAPYKSRLVVYAPKDRKDFSGTVIVEWLNVSGIADSPVDWLAAHEEMVRSGDIYVGVTTQAAGLNALKTVEMGDPARYASLTHPGDSYSYDIFSEAGQAVRDDYKTVLGRSFRPDVVLGLGQSQSSFRMTTYVNAFAPLARVFDGYMVHARGASSAPLAQLPERPAVNAPPVVRIRTDQKVPVMTVEQETDLSVLNYLPARQPDSKTFRLWEIAGAAHGDTYNMVYAGTDRGQLSSDVGLFQALQSPPDGATIGSFELKCEFPQENQGINAGHQHYVLQSAFVALERWVKRGILPRSMPRLSVNSAPNGDFQSFNVDALGNVLGGIRTPSVDAPLAVLSGQTPTAGGFCGVFGMTTPFTPEQVHDLYPTRRDFIEAWTQATNRAVRSGAILPADGRQLIAAGRTYQP
jgi:hypothetical protein